MTRKATPDVMGDLSLTPALSRGERETGSGGESDASLEAMFGAPADGGRVEVALALIDDNPFQERSAYGDLTDLANDIREHGLLQAPVVRRAAGGRYELAFGHRRKRACELAGMTAMPVVIRRLSDEEMATIAFSENEQRMDVTAIDKAVAIQTMQTRFGWSLQEIADKLSMSRPTVSNLLRLLQLPDAVQAKVASGDVSQRSAMAVLAVLDVPEEIRQASDRQWDEQTKASGIVRSALDGASSDEIRKRTAQMLQRFATAIHEEPWYKVEFGEHTPAFEAASCQGCSHALKRDSGVYCTGPAECRKNKAQAWALQDLYEAAAEIGLPAVGLVSGFTSMDDWGTRETLKRLLAGDGCEHGLLGLRWVPKNCRYGKTPYPKFPQAEPVCHHGEGKKCSCVLADQRAKAAQGDGKTNAAAMRMILAAAVPILARALLEVDEGLLRHVLAKRVRYDLGPNSTTLALSLEELAEQVAEKLVSDEAPDYRSVNENRRVVSEWMTSAGLADPFALASGIQAGEGDGTMPVL